MGQAARKLEPTSAAAERLAALTALPLRAEPPTEQEDAIFEQMEAEMRAGVRGHSTEEIRQAIEQMPRDR